MKKATWIVFSLVIVLGLFYFISRQKEISVGVKRINLPTFSADKVDRIEILAKEKITLQKQGDVWQLVLTNKDKQRFLKADQSNVESMLEAALGLKHSHYVTNLAEKYKDLGLEGESATTVRIYSGDNLALDLILGKSAEGTNRYAKLANEADVHVIRGAFWQLTRNGLLDWRDRNIIPVKEGELKTLKINQAKDHSISLAKEEAGEEWNFEQSQTLPKGFRADKTALASMVRSVVNMRASGFVDEPGETKTPILTLEVGTKEATYNIDVFAGSKEHYLVKRRGDEQVYEITQHNFDRLNKSLNDFRDLSLLNFDKNSIVQITLVNAKERIVVKKADAEWRIIEPNKLPKDFEFDASSVDDLLTQLANLRAQRLAHANKDMAQNQNWQKTWLMELTTDKGEKVHLFASKNKANKDEYVVKGNKDQEVYVANAAKLATLNSGIKAFKKEHFELPPIDEGTKGFESLPVDIQRKLLNATRGKK